MATTAEHQAPSVTAEDVVLLAGSSNATLPASTPHSALIAPLTADCPSVPVTAYLSALLTLLSRSPPVPSLLASLLSCLLRLPRDRDTARVLHLFAPHISALDPGHIPSILDLIISNLVNVTTQDDAEPIDLLPRLLDLTVNSNHMDSAHQALDKILAVDWPKALLIKIVLLLRDFPPGLARLRMRDFLDKIFGGMKEVDLQDLPSLVYQLLLLASKGFERRIVIGGIIRFFGGLIKGPASIVRQVEGTVLMHMNFAVKQDPSLGQEVLAVIRTDLSVINHFAVAMLLSVARVRRFGERAIGVLKLSVLASRHDYKVSRQCKWLPDGLKEECLETTKCVEKALIKAVNESNYGREHVVPSIVQLGFALLESVDGGNGEGVGGSDGLMSLQDLGIQMLKTLFEVHDMARNEIIEQCKFRILSLKPQQSAPIINLLGCLVQSYPYAMLEHVTRLKELLDYFTFMHDKTAVSLVNAILPFIKFSRDLQDHIILVVRKAMFRKEDTVRVAATNAIVDLILAETRSKRNGLNSIQESSSQASCSQQAEIPCGISGGLFQELSGLLQRSLSQKAIVKEITYEGLLKLVLLDPFVSGYIFDFLWPHFIRFYDEDEGSLQFNGCFKSENGKICFLEPLDCLLSCVSWILHLQPRGKPENPSHYSWQCFGFSLSQDNEAGRTSSGESFSNALSRIRRSLRRCSMEDGLLKIQDSESHCLQREKACWRGLILQGIIEVFANIIASELETSTDEAKELLEKELIVLVDSYDALEKESSMNKQRNGGRKGSSKTSMQDIPDKNTSESREHPRATLPKVSEMRRHFFATSSIHQLLITAIRTYGVSNSNDRTISQNHSESLLNKTLDRCLKLISFALKACLRQLKSISSMGNGSSVEPLRTLIYADMKLLGRPIMQLVWLLMSDKKLRQDPQKKEDKGKKSLENKEDQLSLSLLCLNELFKISLARAELCKLISDLISMAASELVLENAVDKAHDISNDQAIVLSDECMKHMHLFLEKRLKPLYDSLLTLSLFRESEILSELILTIGKELPLEQRDLHGTWAVGICKNSKIENPNAAWHVVALALHLKSAPNDLIIACDMASELLKVMGSEDKEPIEISETFPVINHPTRTSIASLLMQLVESVITDLDWAISKLKAYSALTHDVTILNKSQFGEKLPEFVLEEALYSRAEGVVHVMSSFADMSLKDSQAEQFLKITVKLYKLMARMTKLRIAPKGCKQPLPGAKFQKLAEVTCKRLTSPLYNFVSLVQRNQQENAHSRGIIGKIKRENKCIPDLIFQIEDYERYLIQLSKLSKVNLLRHAKRSTGRDFKILETKMITQEQTAGNEPCQADSASSEHDSSEESDGNREENGSDKVATPENSAGDGALAEDSESDKEEEEMVVKKKRTMMSKVVHDSDEEVLRQKSVKHYS